jgi:hypothetical protein
MGNQRRVFPFGFVAVLSPRSKITFACYQAKRRSIALIYNVLGFVTAPSLCQSGNRSCNFSILGCGSELKWQYAKHNPNPSELPCSACQLLPPRCPKPNRTRKMTLAK